MSKVTDKFQVTLPMALAERYGIAPGDDIRFEEAGEAIRVVPVKIGATAGGLDTDRRLRLFDAATARQRERQAEREPRRAGSRGWNRGALYDRGGPDAD